MRQARYWIAAIGAMAGVFGSTASAHAQNLAFELQVNATSATVDDYICWSPSAVAIRLLPGSDPALIPSEVRVTGRQASSESTGTLQFQGESPGGIDRSRFAPTESVVVPIDPDGDWTNFSVMGASASTNGKDVVIEVLLDNGTVVASLPVMVRVRKDARDLTDVERLAFLQAVRRLHDADLFEKYWRAHQAAFYHDIHGQFLEPQKPLFGYWHRAFLLNFERELQVLDPNVALPYWKFDEPSYRQDQGAAGSIFSRTFLGEHNASTNLVSFSDVAVDTRHPWTNWRTDADSSALSRARHPDQSIGNQVVGPVSPLGLATILNEAMDYRQAGGDLEYDYHNGAHARINGWLGRAYSPADPLFFLLHANVDRGLAHWQAAHDAFDAGDVEAYHATGAFPGDGEYLDGSYALDGMWPWRPNAGGWPSGMYFQMPQGVNGPDLANPPTPASQLDYLNLAGNGVASGACYDDITYEQTLAAIGEGR